MKIINILLAALIVMMCFTKLFSEDRNQFSSNFGIFLGYGYFDYHEINNQLDTYHQIDGITLLPNIGMEIEYFSNKFILKNQLSTSYYKFENNETWKEQKITFWDVQDQLRFGYPFLNNQSHHFFPFTGVIVQYQSINTDFNYGLLCVDCFFQLKHEYSNFNIGILYGASYELDLPFKNQILKNLKLCF